MNRIRVRSCASFYFHCRNKTKYRHNSLCSHSNVTGLQGAPLESCLLLFVFNIENLIEVVFMKNACCFQPRLEELPSVSCLDKIRAIEKFLLCSPTTDFTKICS